jgi:outer membrane protein insertion porin family
VKHPPRQVAIFVCLLALVVFPVPAQVSRGAGKRIVDIQFSPLQPLDPMDLAKALPLKKGEPLDVDKVALAIDGLFATGRFEDIAVQAEPSGDGVIVRFLVKPTWFVGGASVEGKVISPPNRGQIENAAELTLGAPFRDEDVANAMTQIRHLLDSNGLYEAQVKPEVERDNEAQQVFITFTVTPGKRAKYEMPVIHGDTKLSDSTILRATGWRIPLIHWWRHVTDSRTRGGVQGVLKKYQQQERLMARVELQKLDYDAERRRVQATLATNAGPKVQVKAVETKVSKRTLKKYVPIFQERTVDNDLLVEGMRNLRDYFQSKGYYDADVDFRVLPQQDEIETIEYVISTGERFKLAEVIIAGNKYFNTAVIRERMFMQPASFNVRRGRYSEAFRKRDEENIENLYRSNGFRDVDVTATVERNYQGKAEQIAVTVKIVEGPQWFVDKVSLVGLKQVNREDLESGFASIPGQPFSEVNVASDRSHTLTYYFSQGFSEATFKASWQTSSTPYHVDLEYAITEGSRRYVRDVITSGLVTTRQSLVDKNITLSAGDPLSPITQSAIQRRFYDLGIFARVDTAVENPEGDTDHKYVLYNFEEANRYTLALGVGAQVARFGIPGATDLTAPAGASGFNPSISTNLSRLNFLGVGHTVSLRGFYSKIEQRGSLSYLAPRFRGIEGQNITLSFLYDNSLNVQTFSSRRLESAIQFTHKFSKATTGLFRFAYRRVSTGDIVIPSLLIPQYEQAVRIGMLSGNLVHDRRDNSADPHRGIYNTADIGVASRYFGSQRNFARMLLRNATYYRLSRNVVLARQTQFGVIIPFSSVQGLSEAESIPLPERFFGGGDNSLRAFPYNQAGPRDIGAPQSSGGASSQPTGFPLGGNALFFNNVEVRFPLLGQDIQGVLFHDMGNVFSTLSNMSLRYRQRNLQDFDYTVHDVGLGIRYRTPVGPIRIDLAYGLNPPSFLGFSGNAQQLLQCNPNLPPSELPSFCQTTRQNVSHFQFFFSIGQTF